MKKVSILWRILFILAIGYSLGMFVTIKYLVPPTTEISIGKIKLKGDNNSQSNSFTIRPGEDPLYRGDATTKREVRKERRSIKRDIRSQDRAIKKEIRKRNRDGG